MDIFLLEDDEAIGIGLTYSLENEGYNVTLAKSVKEAEKIIDEKEFSLYILDLTLPDGSGYDVCKRIKAKGDLPVIFLTAYDDEVNVIMGFELGADDYISKPFMPQELLLRVYAVLRRTYKEDSPRVFLDGCTIDFSRAEVNKGGEIIPLTAKEHTLLETLARNEGKIVTVDALCEALWGDNPFGYENSLNAHVRRIREKIEADPSKPVSLITIKGLGYKLITRK